jgi:glycosyltransferase involved in cell wall biosynthesis
MRAKLTCLVPCKNEAANIEACIESFRVIADEVLIADSGSTDETKEIVRALGGCKLIEREFVNYADFKNWAIPQAAHEWVLIVDADERITPELAAEIRTLLENPPAEIDGYWIYRRSFFLGHEIRHCGWDTDCVFRLIRRDRCRYGACRVHEEIFIDPARTADLKAKMLHYTYWSYDQYFAKYLRYTQWGALDMWDGGKRTGLAGLLLRPFLRFLQLYVLKLGFLDGLAGIQVCMLQAFFVSFVKQGRLWEMRHAKKPPASRTAAEILQAKRPANWKAA